MSLFFFIILLLIFRAFFSALPDQIQQTKTYGYQTARGALYFWLLHSQTSSNRQTRVHARLFIDTGQALNK